MHEPTDWYARALALERIILDLHWMARRYAHGRASYATALFNSHTKALLRLGVPLNPTDNRIFADDAMGQGFADLSNGELAMERAYCARHQAMNSATPPDSAQGTGA